MKRLAAILSAVLCALVFSPANASATTITDFNGATCATSVLCAQAEFTITGGGQLQVVLTNLGTAASDPIQGLTGVFWDGIAGLTPVSAFLTTTPTTSTFLQTSTCIVVGCSATGNVGGEFEYLDYALAGGGTESGISSAGLGIFGAGNFNGSNLEGPVAVNGLNFSIVNGVLNPNGGLAGSPLISNSVTFLLNVPGTFSLTQIQHVEFQYGTTLADTCLGCTINTLSSPLTPTPEPATLALLGTGLAVVSTRIRRRQKK
jgi:hypothetical protein